LNKKQQTHKAQSGISQPMNERGKIIFNFIKIEDNSNNGETIKYKEGKA